MQRISLKPTKEKEFLSCVLEYYATNTLLLLELAKCTNELKQLHNNNLVIPPFKNEYSIGSEVIALKLNDDTIKNALPVIMKRINLKENIGAIHILEGQNLVFLSGDNFHPECISFLAIKSNEKIVNQLIANKMAEIIFGPSDI